jgi:dTDP-4-amino-4,6-dideoxygalactose transaminase
MTPRTGIPFVDLVTPHVELEEQLVDALRGLLRTGAFIGGPALTEFEAEFARFCDTDYCVGVSSGTDALRFALMAADIGPGDVVITVPNTFVATVEAIVQAGATPHFVDIDPRTFNLSVDALKEYLRTRGGPHVKAIMPVHLYGQMCDMDALMAVAEEHGLMVFEDACQAHGSEYFSAKHNRWQKAGSIGTAAAFSFYPGKNLGACGEAGAVTTRDEKLAQRIRMIRDHGQNKKYHHLVEGYNGRLDAMQAALLRVKLPFLGEWNAKRRDAAAIYNQLLKDAGDFQTPAEADWSRSNYHLYVIRTPQRDALQQHLTEKNIGSGLHYPIPLHLQQGYLNLGYKAGDFPISEGLSGEILSLPMYPQIRREQQERVVEALVEFDRSRSTSGENSSKLINA